MPLNFGNGFDILLYFVAFGLVMLAQGKVQSAYRKYRQIGTISGVTGAEIARKILALNNIDNVTVQLSQGGELSDNFNSKNMTLNLSKEIYEGTSIASVAVAAHESGHAIQHHEGYKFLVFRQILAPIVTLTSTLSMPVLILGLFTRVHFLFTIAIILFGVAAFFQLVTLPVEFDASKRALKILQDNNFLVGAEVQDAKKMLSAAAFTYVAGLASTVIQIIRLLGYRNRR